MIKIILILMLIITTTNTAEARNKTPQLTTKNAILSIIGEAENQGAKGMLAVACAIRNRGTLSGVYGLNAPRVRGHKYSQSTYTTALKVWNQSAIPQSCGFIGSADGWENITAFGSPSWVRYSTLTAVIGDHRFYKQNTKRKA